MRYVNRAFHFTEKASISYSDVQSNSWYYDTVRIAEKYGYINGTGNGRMNPEGYVTREQRRLSSDGCTRPIRAM